MTDLPHERPGARNPTLAEIIRFYLSRAAQADRDHNPAESARYQAAAERWKEQEKNK